MKKIFFVALAATLLAASCQKTEVINPVGGDAISFAAGMNKLTKSVGTADADSTGMVNLQAQDFRVWSYYVADDPNTGKKENDLYDGMGNSLVEYENESWSTDKQYYWPGQGKELRFFAVSADVATHEDAGDVEKGKVSVNDDRTKLTIAGFVVNHESPNTDLMVADFIKKSQGTTPEEKAVNLIFRHALSKVEFKFKTDTKLNTPVWVQEVSVSNVKTTSTLEVEEVEGVTKMTWGTRSVDQVFYDDYVNADDEVALPENIVTDETVTLHEAVNAMSLTDDAETFTTWMVLPQDIKKGDIDLKVDVVYVMGDRQFKASFSLGTETLDAWAENQYVTYTITLTPNLISFNPTVKPWTPAGTPGDNITEDTPKEEGRGN